MSEGITRLDEIEASMMETKAWGEQGPEHRARAVHRSAEQMKKLALVLAELTESPEAIAQTKRIVSLFQSI